MNRATRIYKVFNTCMKINTLYKHTNYVNFSLCLSLFLSLCLCLSLSCYILLTFSTSIVRSHSSQLPSCCWRISIRIVIRLCSINLFSEWGEYVPCEIICSLGGNILYNLNGCFCIGTYRKYANDMWNEKRQNIQCTSSREKQTSKDKYTHCTIRFRFRLLLLLLLNEKDIKPLFYRLFRTKTLKRRNSSSFANVIKTIISIVRSSCVCVCVDNCLISSSRWKETSI